MWNIFEVVGTIAFAISGALVGIEKKLDIFGIIMLAVTTAVGGGILRDTFIGNTPPVAFRDPTFTIISVLAAVSVCLVYERINRFQDIIQVFDALGLGAFTATGANIAIQMGLNTLFIMVVLGVTTGVGGGIVRDVFVGEIPYVFRKEVYAVASIAGAVSLFYAYSVLTLAQAMYLCFAITVIIRLVSIKYDAQLPIISKRDSAG